MLFRELNRSKCKTYLIACEETRRAALVDPLKEKLERYVAMLAYHGLRLEAVIDTHTHADHRTASFDLRELVGATAIMHRRAPAPHIDRHVDDGDTIAIGNLRMRVLATPGHTPDGISLVCPGCVLTGDTLMIRGTGPIGFRRRRPGGAVRCDHRQAVFACRTRRWSSPRTTTAATSRRRSATRSAPTRASRDAPARPTSIS